MQEEDRREAMQGLRVETSSKAEAPSSSPESGFAHNGHLWIGIGWNWAGVQGSRRGAPSRGRMGRDPRCRSSTAPAHSPRPPSRSPSKVCRTSPGKEARPERGAIGGILKRRKPAFLRTQSECEVAGGESAGSLLSPFPSLASLYGEEDEEEEDEDERVRFSAGDGKKKNVRFSERIIKHHFAARAAIAPLPGEGKNRSKKNAKRKLLRLRRNSQGESTTASEAGTGDESDASASASVASDAAADDKALQFPIEPIPEAPEPGNAAPDVDWDEPLARLALAHNPARPHRSRRAHVRSGARPLSISDDEEEEPWPQPQPQSPPPERADEDTTHHADGEGEGWCISAAEKKRLKKKRKKAAKAAAKATATTISNTSDAADAAALADEDRKGSQDSGYATNEDPPLPQYEALPSLA